MFVLSRRASKNTYIDYQLEVDKGTQTARTEFELKSKPLVC